MAERQYVALDLETTGLNNERDAIIEVAAVRIQGSRIVDRFSSLIDPGRPIPLQIEQLTGICDDDVVGAPTIDKIAPELLAFVDSNVAGVIAHNARFDIGFLRSAGIQFHRPALDTFELAAILLPGMTSYSLGELCRALNIRLEDAHRALDDTVATAHLFITLRDRLRQLSINTLEVMVATAQESQWPPAMLFEDALQERGGAAGPTPRTDLSNNIDRLVSVERNEPLQASSLVDKGGPPPSVVDLASIETIFAEDGDLADLLGSDFEVRAGQADMARHVLDALNQGDHLIVEAGTGVGKSLAYLAPAAFWSRQNERRVVIATNTISLQDQLVEKEIPQAQALLERAGHESVQTALLKGRNNYLCLRRLQEWIGRRKLSHHELSVLARVLVWLPTTRTGDVGELFLPAPNDRAVWQQICSDSATCSPARCSGRPGMRDFYWDAHRRAQSAHVLIINHALLIADISANSRLLPSFSHLIVDEAHRLEEATTDQLTVVIDWRKLRRQLERLSLEGDLMQAALALAKQGGQDGLSEHLAGVTIASRQTISGLLRFADSLRLFARQHKEARSNAGYAQRLSLDSRTRSQPEWSEIEIEWDHASQPLQRVVGELQDVLERMVARKWQSSEPEARYLAQFRAIHSDLETASTQIGQIVFQPVGGAEQKIVAWLEYTENKRDRGEGEARLICAPLYVGEQLQESLIHRCRTTVFTGATLRSGPDFRYVRERLGLWDAGAISIPSPYDYERNALLILPQNLPAPNQSDYQQAVEQAIIDAAMQAGGRTMALFTSYAHLRTTATAIRPTLDSANISLLQQGMSGRNRILREYRRADRAVLLGTRTFWEGIDLPGEQLSVLMIVRLPFAVPSDPLVAARSHEFDNPFKEYMLPDAVLKFRQGFGRLIRRSTDRGVVVLLDNRVWQKSYGQVFLDSLPPCTVHRTQLANLATEVDLWLNGEHG